MRNSVNLVVDNISLVFGGVSALQKIGFEINKPGIYSIIGPNGAGKTCVVNCITGFYKPNVGKIIWNNKDITSAPPNKIAEMGIGRTFQNIALYTGMTVLQNIMAGRHVHIKYSPLDEIGYFGKAQKEEAKHRTAVEEIIEFLEIEAFRGQVVGLLPYGLRKRVDLARALAMDPKLLLLDEPMAGMNIEEKEEMARFIIDILELRKIPIVLIEHDMDVVMDISDNLVVLDIGKKIAEGKPEEIRVNPVVIKAYLGDEEA